MLLPKVFAHALRLVAALTILGSLVAHAEVNPRARLHAAIGHNYDSTFRFEVVRELGSGQRMVAREVQHNLTRYRHLSVLKEIRTVRPEEMAAGSENEVKELLAHRLVAISKVLRHNSMFQARFGDIVPKTISPTPGFLLQAKADGVAMAALGPTQRQAAKLEMAAARDMAEGLLPGFRFSVWPENFTFDRHTGNIRSWYDLLSDTQPQPALSELSVVRQRDHTRTEPGSVVREKLATKDLRQKHHGFVVREKLGEGYNAVGYLIEGANEYRVLKEFKDSYRAAERAATLVEVANSLRNSRRFASKFGKDVIPKTKLTPDGTGLLLTKLRGVPFDKLAPEHKEIAKHEIASAVSLAREVLPKVAFDDWQPNNFWFAPATGKLTGWSDHVLHH